MSRLRHKDGHSWKLYATTKRSGPFVQFYLWPSRKAMNQTLKGRGIRSHPKALGLTVSPRKHRRSQRSFAEIHTFLRAADADTIAHEATHAGMAYIAKRKLLGKVNDRRRVEELLARVVGRLTQQIADGMRGCCAES